MAFSEYMYTTWMKRSGVARAEERERPSSKRYLYCSCKWNKYINVALIYNCADATTAAAAAAEQKEFIRNCFYNDYYLLSNDPKGKSAHELTILCIRCASASVCIYVCVCVVFLSVPRTMLCIKWRRILTSCWWYHLRLKQFDSLWKFNAWQTLLRATFFRFEFNH